jgi:hypothetical protein
VIRKLWAHSRSSWSVRRVRLAPSSLRGFFDLIDVLTFSLTNPLLLISLAFLVLGFAAINKFGMFLTSSCRPSRILIWYAAPEATQFGDHVVTQKHLYTGLFIIGIPMFWLAGPFSTFFWLIGASSVLVLGHASLLEPGVESEYASIQENV